MSVIFMDFFYIFMLINSWIIYLGFKIFVIFCSFILCMHVKTMKKNIFGLRTVYIRQLSKIIFWKYNEQHYLMKNLSCLKKHKSHTISFKHYQNCQMWTKRFVFFRLSSLFQIHFTWLFLNCFTNKRTPVC